MMGARSPPLMQYTEFIITGGSAFGSVVIGYSFKGAIGVVTAMWAC